MDSPEFIDFGYEEYEIYEYEAGEAEDPLDYPEYDFEPSSDLE
jgi:hypothetical protein